MPTWEKSTSARSSFCFFLVDTGRVHACPLSPLALGTELVTPANHEHRRRLVEEVIYNMRHAVFAASGKAARGLQKIWHRLKKTVHRSRYVINVSDASKCAIVISFHLHPTAFRVTLYMTCRSTCPNGNAHVGAAKANIVGAIGSMKFFNQLVSRTCLTQKLWFLNSKPDATQKYESTQAKSLHLLKPQVSNSTNECKEMLHQHC
jgi:hypothetical protein